MCGAMSEPRDPYDPETGEPEGEPFPDFDPETGEPFEPSEVEPPPVDLGAATGDVAPWGTVVLLLSWALVFAALAFRHELGDTDALYAWGASAPGLAPLETAWRLLAS